jgi:hypothetical protein
MVMALPAVLIASLLLMVESQASDVADQGFLSKYMPSTSDASQRSMSDYDKFISPNINPEKHGNGLDASIRTYWSPATDDRPVLRPASQGQDSMAITAARGKPSISAKDFDLPKIADREEKFFLQAAQKLLANDSNNPASLFAIGIGLVSLGTMLGLSLQRWLQPATVLFSSGGLGPDMPMTNASALGDNVMEMKSQDLNVNSSAAELGTRFRSPHNANSGIVGWGQLSSQSLHAQTLCFAQTLDPATGTDFDEEDEEKNSQRRSGRLALTREMIERRFEAPAVDRPEEVRPAALEKVSTVVDKPDDMAHDKPADGTERAAPLSNAELAAWFAPPVEGTDESRAEIVGAKAHRARDEGLHSQIRNMGRTKLLTSE